MPDPSTAQGHYDLVLTSFAVSYMQKAENFVADKVFPVVPVALASSFYWEIPRGAFLRDEVGPRPYGGYPRHIGYDLIRGQYAAEEEALEAWLDDRERKNYNGPQDPEKNKVRLLTSQHMIHRDRRWASAFFAPGVWATDIVGVAGAPAAGQIKQWDQASSTPIQDIDGFRDTMGLTGYGPNVLVLGTKTYRVLKSHPDILDRIKYTQRGQVTADLLAELFEVDRVVVPRGVMNTAAEGDADAISYIVGANDAFLAYANPNPGLDQPTAGAIFAWTGLLGDNAFNPMAGVFRGRDDRAYSDWFHVKVAYDMHVVARDLGIFFDNPVPA